MHAYGGVYHSWVGLGQLDGLSRFRQVGAGDDEFLTPGGARALDHEGEVGGVALRAVVETRVDWIGQVDAYLLWEPLG